MSSTITSQSFGEQYHQFLCDLGQAICDKISADQDVAALNELQSKEYLLDKIKEIIQTVYEVKNQQVFMKQLQQIEHQRAFIIDQESEIKKLYHALQSQKSNSMNQPQPNELESELQKQNWQLSKRLIEQDQQNKMRVKQFAQTIKIMERQQESARVAFSNELSSAIEGIKLWQEKYKTLYQQKSTLENVLEQQVERHLQQQMRTRELNQEKEEMELSVQKMTKLNKGMKEQVDRLEDKVIRLEKNKQSLEEQIKTYQQEIKALKKVNQELNDKEGMNSHRKSSLGEAKELIKNLKQVQQQQQKAESEEKARKMFELEKKLQKSKQNRQQIELQFHEYKLSAEKRTFELEQQMNQLKIKHEKQVRIMKQSFLKQKQSLTESNDQQLSDLQQNSSQKYQQQIHQLEQSLKTAQQKLVKSKSQLKDLETFMHQKELHYTETLHQLQKKNEEFRTYIRQLQKSIKDKSSSSTDFLKEYGMKVDACEEQVTHYKKQNKKLRKDIEVLRKQLDKVNLTLITEKNRQSQTSTQRKLKEYKREDYEEYIKQISELKHKILIQQNEHKFTLKQTQNQLQTIQQLKGSNTKLQQKNQNYKNHLTKLQKQLVTARKQLSQHQTHHHNQLSHIYKSHESRIQAQKKQLKAHYDQLLKNRQQRLDQCRNSTLMYEHQLTINTLRSNIQILRENNASLNSKIQTLNGAIKDLNRQLQLKDNSIQQAKQQITQLNKNLFMCKQQNIHLQNAIRQKLKHNQLIFASFKHQIHVYIQNQLSQLKQTSKQVITMLNAMKSSFTQMKQTLTIQVHSQSTMLQSKIKQSIKSIKSQYDHQVNITHKLAIQQLQQDFSQKLKQHQVDTMAEIASREFLIQQQQKQLTNIKSHKDKMQLSIKNHIEQHKKLKDQTKLVKEVAEKATDKSTKLQKLLIQTQQQLKSLTSDNTALKQQILKIQHLYQDKLDNCRQKYIQQNEKLFSKYQKEFDRLVGMNAKVKNTALSNMMFSTIAPTKEYDALGHIHDINTMKSISKDKDTKDHKKDTYFSDSIARKQPTNEKKESGSKLQNIKKQILLQKKKLQSLDSTKKIPTKGSMSSTNLLKSKKLID